MSLTPQQQQNLDAIAPDCIQWEQQSGVPAVVTCAQWIIESGYGLHMPPNSNNPFGIKQYPGCAGRVMAATHEWFNQAQLKQFLARGDGRRAAPDPKIPPRHDGAISYIVMDWFATFPTFTDAFRYRSRLLLSSPLYSNAIKNYKIDQDAGKFIDEIAKHYSTSEDYAEKLKDIAFGAAVTKALQAARG